MRVYFAESKQDRAGFRDRCFVQAESPLEAAILANDALEQSVEYLWLAPQQEADKGAYTLFELSQWRVKVFGHGTRESDFILES